MTKKQEWKSTWVPISGYGKNAVIQATVCFDDRCKNGHATFTITGEVRIPGRGDCEACGCLHGDIARKFPNLAPLIKWHLTSTDGPMDYLSNTVLLAGDRDCWGLKKGERRQIINGRTQQPCWELVGVVNGMEVPHREVPNTVDADVCPEAPTFKYAPWCRVGEGKERQLDAARRTAVWPEATDEQLSLPPGELKTLLRARLPALMQAFRADMEAFGFEWPETETTKETQ